MSKINLDLTKELQKYEQERQNLFTAMNQTQQRVDEIRTQVIRREGIIAWIKGMLQEEAEKGKKKPQLSSKPNLKQQKADLMKRAKQAVDKVKTEQKDVKQTEKVSNKP